MLVRWLAFCYSFYITLNQRSAALDLILLASGFWMRLLVALKVLPIDIPPLQDKAEAPLL